MPDAPRPFGTPRAPALPQSTMPWVVAMLLVGTAALGGATVWMIERARRELIEDFAAEQMKQLEVVVQDVEDAFQHLSSDLALLTEAVGGAPTGTDRALLDAFVGSVRPYRAAALFESGAVSASLFTVDPAWPEPPVDTVRALMAATAARAMAQVSGTIETSVSLDGRAFGSYRVFAAALPRTLARPAPAALALLVDTSSYVSPVRTLAATRFSEVLVVGPHGRPVPIGGEAETAFATVRAAASTDGLAARALADLHERMLAREAGTLRLPRRVAELLDLPASDVVAVYRPIEVGEGRPWSVAVLTSFAQFRSHELAIVWRVGLLGVAAITLLGAVVLRVVRAKQRTDRLQHELQRSTQIAELQARLLHAEKLATVGQLAAGIAHEIGTPLSVIRHRAEHAATRLGADHAQTKGLRTIVEQAEYIARTVRGLLDYARVHTPRVVPVPVGPLLERAADLVGYETGRRRVTVYTEAAEGLPPLAADPDQMNQVLVNLILNAADACLPGGRVRVAASLPGGDGFERCAGGASPGAGARATAPTRVRLEVEDDGCGIAREDLPRVFDAFFTTKDPGAGTGLGLAIVERIVAAHAASIRIDSQPGTGTRVVLDWPTTLGLDAGRRPAEHHAPGAG